MHFHLSSLTLRFSQNGCMLPLLNHLNHGAVCPTPSLFIASEMPLVLFLEVFFSSSKSQRRLSVLHPRWIGCDTFLRLLFFIFFPPIFFIKAMFSLSFLGIFPLQSVCVSSVIKSQVLRSLIPFFFLNSFSFLRVLKAKMSDEKTES